MNVLPPSPPAGIHSTQTVPVVQAGNPIQVTLTPNTRK